MRKYLNIIINTCITLTAVMVLYSCSKDVSVTPPDAPPPNGYIFIDSNPEGFQIYLNNLERGRITPDSLTWLSSSTYKITLKKDLYKDSSFTINAVEGKKLSVFIDYAKDVSMNGSISCTSNPGKAEIFLNGANTGYLTPFTLQNISPGNYYVRYHLLNCRDDSAYVTVSSSSYSSVYKFLIDTTIWQYYTMSNSAIPSNNLTCVTVDKNNTVYAGSSDNGFFSFDGTNWKKYYNSLSSQITCGTIDKSNIVLFGTPNGFVSFNGVGRNQYGFMSSGLTSYNVQSISTDNEGNWFIGTSAGLNEFYQPNGVMSWRSYIIPGDDQSNYIVTSAVDMNDNVWVGILNDGVEIKDANNNWIPDSTYLSKLQSNNVTAIAAGPTGEVWIGYGMDGKLGHGLTCYNGSSWNNYYPTPAYSKTTAIFIDSKNVKWVGTDQGLVMFLRPHHQLFLLTIRRG